MTPFTAPRERGCKFWDLSTISWREIFSRDRFSGKNIPKFIGKIHCLCFFLFGFQRGSNCRTELVPEIKTCKILPKFHLVETTMIKSHVLLELELLFFLELSIVRSLEESRDHSFWICQFAFLPWIIKSANSFRLSKAKIIWYDKKCHTFLVDILKREGISKKILKIIISGLNTELTTELPACKKNLCYGLLLSPTSEILPLRPLCKRRLELILTKDFHLFRSQIMYSIHLI